MASAPKEAPAEEKRDLKPGEYTLGPPAKQEVYPERPYEEAVSKEHAEFLKSKGLL